MIYGSVCSGIEAATVAWEPLGWHPAFFAEIDKFPSAVLAHHYPEVPNAGDFTTIKGDEYGAIDVLVGGTPCQDFSIAGLRAGLDGERGNLTLEFLKLVDRARPRYVVWENVPGVLSSVSHQASDPCPPKDPLDMERDGQEVESEDEYDSEELHAFNSFLAGLSELGYGWAYRVLDAQHFGVPQRRRRVFVIGYPGDWRRAAAVLFESFSLSGHPPPSREARKIAPTIPSRSLGGGGLGTDFDCDGGFDESSITSASTGDIAHCLNAGGMGRQDYETETLITHALRGEGFDASEDGTGRGTPLVPVVSNTLTSHRGDGGGGLGADAGDISPTLRSMGHDGSHANAGGQVAVVIPIADQATRFAGTDGSGNQSGKGHGLGVGEPGDPMYTITSGDKHAIAIQAGALRENPDSGPDGIGIREDGIAYTLEARAEVQAVAFTQNQEGDVLTGDIMHSLGTNSNATNVSIQTYQKTVRSGARDAEGELPPEKWEAREVAATLNGFDQGDKRSVDLAVTPSMQVRRLTSEECESLQGFKRGYTKINDQTADGPRYKALGNSMAVPVMRWIGERIQMVDSL